MDRLDEFRAKGRLLGAIYAQVTATTGLGLSDDEVEVAYRVRNDLMMRKALEQQDAGASIEEAAEFLAAANRRYFEVLDEIVVGLREAAKSAPVPPAPPPVGNRTARRAAKAKAGMH